MVGIGVGLSHTKAVLYHAIPCDSCSIMLQNYLLWDKEVGGEEVTQVESVWEEAGVGLAVKAASCTVCSVL